MKLQQSEGSGTADACMTSGFSLLMMEQYSLCVGAGQGTAGMIIHLLLRMSDFRGGVFPFQ